MVRFSGTINNASGHVVGVTFAFYKDDKNQIPLWIEMQNVPVDDAGRYTVELGSTLPEGVPRELFASRDARWLGIQPQGQPEQPRVLLLSVPYALKAAGAQTLVRLVKNEPVFSIFTLLPVAGRFASMRVDPAARHNEEGNRS